MKLENLESKYDFAAMTTVEKPVVIVVDMGGPQFAVCGVERMFQQLEFMGKMLAEPARTHTLKTAKSAFTVENFGAGFPSDTIAKESRLFERQVSSLHEALKTFDGTKQFLVLIPTPLEFDFVVRERA